MPSLHLYTPGQHDDARMNISMAMTSLRLGGALTNHTEVLCLLKKTNAEGQERVCGVRVKDLITGQCGRVVAQW